MSLDFDGVNDGVEIGSPSTLDNIWAGGASISWWMKLDSFGETGFGRIADKSSSTGAANGWGLQMDDGTDSLRFEINFSTTDGQWTSPLNSIVTGVWVHCVFTYNSDSVANVPSFYIDGVLQALTTLSTPVGAAVTDAAQGLTIANFQGDSTIRSFDGHMADLRIFSRELDAVEAEIIANGEGIDAITDGLLAWWPMDDTIEDVSGADFYAVGSTAVTGSGTTVTPAVEPETEDGDTLIMVIASGGDSSNVPENITTPAGWTHINAGQTDLPATVSTPSVWVYRRTASSEPGSYVVTGNQTCTKLGVILTFKGIPAAEDVASTINTGTDASPVSPSVSPSAAAMVLRVCVCDDDDIVPESLVNFPAGVNARKSFEATGVGNGVGLLISTELDDAGATGTKTFTLVGAEEWGCLTFAWVAGQGLTGEYLKDISDNAHDGVFFSGPNFSEDRPEIQSARML